MGRDNNETVGECHMIAPLDVPTAPGSRPPTKCVLLRPDRYIGYAPRWAQRAWQTRSVASEERLTLRGPAKDAWARAGPVLAEHLAAPGRDPAPGHQGLDARRRDRARRQMELAPRLDGSERER